MRSIAEGRTPHPGIPRLTSPASTQLVSGAEDYIVLSRPVESHEECAIPCHSHYKVTILFGMLRGIQQSMSAHRVELHVPEFQVAEPLQQCHQAAESFLGFQACRRQPQV